MATVQLPSRRAAGPPLGLVAVIVAGVVALAAVGVLAYTALTATPGSTQVNLPGVTAAADTVTIDATGTVKVTPDVMNVSLGVEVTRPSVRDALSTANAEAAKLIDTVKAQGVDPKDIRTQNVSVEAQYNYNVTPRALTGYHASNVLSVTLRDLSKAGAIISTAADSVGNDIVIQGAQVTHFSTPDEIKQARQLAVQDASVKAGQYASLTSRKVGKVLSISDDYVTFTTFPQGGGIGGGGGVPVEAGQGNVVARVKVTYALEN